MYASGLRPKLAAYYVTGVMALFAEALHTLSDIFISGFLLLAALYSRRAADERHMFGYGRAQNIRFSGCRHAVHFVHQLRALP